MSYSLRSSYRNLLVTLCAAFAWLCAASSKAQSQPPSPAGQPQLVQRLGDHEYRAQIDLMTGDTLAVIYLKDVYCFTKKHFRNKRHEADYWRMVRDVKKTLPLAKEVKRVMVQAYLDTQGMSEREERAYYKRLEDDLTDKYKDRLKKLNYRQGKLLVRLVNRETDRLTLQIIREMLGKGRAFFWNMMAKMFGVSLKTEWDPNGADRELEDICIQVEQGMI